MKVVRTIPEETIPSREIEILIHTISIDIDTKNISITASENGQMIKYHTSYSHHWDEMTEENKNIIEGFFKSAVKCCFNIDESTTDDITLINDSNSKNK